MSTPTIEAMREWLRGCPLIAAEQSESGAAFRIAGLSPEPLVEFSIEDSPTEPVLVRYFSGVRMARSFLFVSRREYSEVQSTQIASSGFFEQLAEWVETQSARHQLPRLEPPRRALSVAVTASGYIVTSAQGSCRMQMQLRLVYDRPNF